MTVSCPYACFSGIPELLPPARYSVFIAFILLISFYQAHWELTWTRLHFSGLNILKKQWDISQCSLLQMDSDNQRSPLPGQAEGSVVPRGIHQWPPRLADATTTWGHSSRPRLSGQGFVCNSNVLGFLRWPQRDEVGREPVSSRVWLAQVGLGILKGKLDLQAVLRQALNRGKRRLAEESWVWELPLAAPFQVSQVRCVHSCLWALKVAAGFWWLMMATRASEERAAEQEHSS